MKNKLKCSICDKSVDKLLKSHLVAWHRKHLASLFGCGTQVYACKECHWTWKNSNITGKKLAFRKFIQSAIDI